MSDVAARPVTTVIDVKIPREGILNVQKFLENGISRGDFEDGKSHSSWEHSFIPGGYARQMLIAKFTLVVGKIHLYPCFNFIMSGRVTVFSEDGIRDIVAPFFFVSQPKAKRIVYAHDETLWITVHGTMDSELKTIDDLEAVEKKLFFDDFDELESRQMQEITS